MRDKDIVSNTLLIVYSSSFLIYSDDKSYTRLSASCKLESWEFPDKTVFYIHSLLLSAVETQEKRKSPQALLQNAWVWQSERDWNNLSRKEIHYYQLYYIEIFVKSKSTLQWKIHCEYKRNEHHFFPQNIYRNKVFGKMYKWAT